MSNDELAAMVAELRARLRSAEHRVSDVEAELKELRSQKLKVLVGTALILGSAVTGLVLYIFRRNHPF